jgi:ZIP family zinc transporter
MAPLPSAFDPRGGGIAVIAALLWGALATSSLLLGGLIASRVHLSQRSLGMLMAFGAGTLISAVSFELVFEAVQRSLGSGFSAVGFFLGAFSFYFSDQWIAGTGARQGRGSTASGPGNLAIPMVLGIILDGIPESVVIGLGILENNVVSLAMLVAIFLSNLPEAVAGTIGMQESGWSRRRIMLLWLVIALVCAGASAAGYSLFSTTPKAWLSLIQAFAGGAILMMLSNSMIPESYELAGKLAGILTVLGFFVSVSIIVFEASHA